MNAHGSYPGSYHPIYLRKHRFDWLKVGVLLVAAIMLLTACPIYGQSSSFGDTRRDELRKAFLLTSTPLVSDARARSLDFDAEWSRLLVIYNNRYWQIQNPELARSWADIEAKTELGLKTLAAIAEIDKRKPSGWDIFIKSLPEHPTEEQKNDRDADIWLRILAELGKVGLQSQFRDQEAALDRSIGTLQAVADNISPYPGSNTIGVSYLPSWLGTYDGDLLDLRNNTGYTLSNAMVVATVHFSNGGSLTHVHSVDHWNPGEKLEAIYNYEAGDYQPAMTGQHPDYVNVAVYYPAENTLGVAKSSYALTDAEWDRIVSSYSSKLRIDAQYLGAFNDDSDSHDRHPAGLEFACSGLRQMPIERVEIRFTRPDSTVGSAYWPYSPAKFFEANEKYPFRTGYLDGPTPAHIDIYLTLAGTDRPEHFHIY